MTSADESPEPEWKSLDVIRGEVEIERELQEKIADSLDSRAGLLLGFAGVVAGLAATQGPAGIAGALLAVAATVLAAVVLWPRTKSVMDTESLFRQYVYNDAIDTAKEALRRRNKNLKDNADLHKEKVRRLKQAIVILIAAIAVTVIGLAVQAVVPATTKESTELEQSKSGGAG